MKVLGYSFEIEFGKLRDFPVEQNFKNREENET